MRTRTLTRTLAALAAALLVLGLAACGDDDADDAADTGDDTEDVTSTTAAEADDPAVEGATIVAVDNDFETATLSVAPGATVELRNDGSNPHTVTSDDDGAFDTGTVSGGSSGELVAPSEPGTYAFHCDIHPNAMQGTLTVA